MAILKLTLQTVRASYRDVKGLLPYYYYMGHVYGVCAKRSDVHCDN